SLLEIPPETGPEVGAESLRGSVSLKSDQPISGKAGFCRQMPCFVDSDSQLREGEHKEAVAEGALGDAHLVVGSSVLVVAADEIRKSGDVEQGFGGVLLQPSANLRRCDWNHGNRRPCTRLDRTKGLGLTLMK